MGSLPTIYSRIVPTLSQTVFGIILGKKDKDNKIELDYQSLIDLTTVSTPCYLDHTSANQRARQYPFDESKTTITAEGKLLNEGKIAIATANTYELEKILTAKGYRYKYNIINKRYGYIFTTDQTLIENSKYVSLITNLTEVPSITDDYKLCIFSIQNNVDNDDLYQQQNTEKTLDITIYYAVEFVSNMSKTEKDKPKFIFYTFTFEGMYDYYKHVVNNSQTNKTLEYRFKNIPIFREQVSFLKQPYISTNYNKIVKADTYFDTMVNEYVNNNITTIDEQQPSQQSVNNNNTSNITYTNFNWPYNTLSLGTQLENDYDKNRTKVPTIVITTPSFDTLSCDISNISSINIRGYVIPYSEYKILGIYLCVYNSKDDLYYTTPLLAYKKSCANNDFSFDFSITHAELVSANLTNNDNFVINIFAIDNYSQHNNAVITILNSKTSTGYTYGPVQTFNQDGSFNLVTNYKRVGTSVSNYMLYINRKPYGVIPNIKQLNNDSNEYEIFINNISLPLTGEKYKCYFSIDDIYNNIPTTYVSNEIELNQTMDDTPALILNQMNKYISTNKLNIVFNYNNMIYKSFNNAEIYLNNGVKYVFNYNDFEKNGTIYTLRDVLSKISTSPMDGSNALVIRLNTMYGKYYDMNYSFRYMNPNSLVLNNVTLDVDIVSSNELTVSAELTLPTELVNDYIVSAILTVQHIELDVSYMFNIGMLKSIGGKFAGVLNIDTRRWAEGEYSFDIEVKDAYGLIYINE